MTPVSSPQSSRRTDRATAEIQAAAGRVEAITRFFTDPEVKAWLEAAGKHIAGLAEQLPESEPGEGRRLIGENTRAGLRRMAHNRGRQ